MENQKSGSLHVLVCVDDSKYSYNALIWAATHIFVTAKKISLLHVYPHTPIDALPGNKAVAGGYVEHINKVVREMSEQKANQLLKEYAAVIEKMGYKPDVVKSIITSSNSKVKMAILNYVDKNGIDMLVCGSRGAGAMSRALIGSVSDFLTQQATCPVLVIREQNLDTTPMDEQT
ncbi:hypothetical protein AAMO2058_000011400 [Amorphochlora amoebiformis]|mmetsp:Transcript_33408/g.53712  ORF Transcript_33408/g.53712 Transcript_33408/m.53712 type:complete len:175 (-) Transcript_33408:104-628(-)